MPGENDLLSCLISCFDEGFRRKCFSKALIFVPKIKNLSIWHIHCF